MPGEKHTLSFSNHCDLVTEVGKQDFYSFPACSFLRSIYKLYLLYLLYSESCPFAFCVKKDK